MLMNKDAVGFLAPFAHKIESLSAVPIAGHEHHEPLELCRLAKDHLGIAVAAPVADIDTAMERIATNGLPSNVLICGSLYLAGEVLRANDQVPD
jgi:dihydrofolate synthase/folylpolyglutamate synthase